MITKLTLVLLVLNYHICTSQKQTQILTDIENKYQVINELIGSNSLRQEQINYSCTKLSERGILTFYYNSNELKHIIHNYTKKHITYKDEYYIWNESLFFQFTTHKIWNKNLSKSELTNTMNKEKQIYFKDEKPIKCISKNMKNNCIKDKNTSCNHAAKALQKFKTLLTFQKLNTKNTCMIPESISKILSHTYQISTPAEISIYSEHYKNWQHLSYHLSK